MTACALDALATQALKLRNSIATCSCTSSRYPSKYAAWLPYTVYGLSMGPCSKRCLLQTGALVLTLKVLSQAQVQAIQQHQQQVSRLLSFEFERKGERALAVQRGRGVCVRVCSCPCNVHAHACVSLCSPCLWLCHLRENGRAGLCVRAHVRGVIHSLFAILSDFVSVSRP